MNDLINEIEARLFELADPEYKAFHQKLMPGYAEDRIIGVRTPLLRKLANELSKRKNINEFIDSLPHRYYEENNLHAFIISKNKNLESSILEVQAFLPYIDNWATCDCWAPKSFEKNTDKLLPYIKSWLASPHTYTVRYALGTLMRFYLDKDFKPEYLEIATKIRSEEYYINMMLAWYFATALAKQYNSTIPYLTDHKLSEWVHNKTIQKAIESYRISDETKQYLKTLRIK